MKKTTATRYEIDKNSVKFFDGNGKEIKGAVYYGGSLDLSSLTIMHGIQLAMRRVWERVKA